MLCGLLDPHCSVWLASCKVIQKYSLLLDQDGNACFDFKVIFAFSLEVADDCRIDIYQSYNDTFENGI